jgi:hypothetical protein
MNIHFVMCMAEHKFKIRWPEAKLERKAGMVSAATRGHLASFIR